MHFKKISVILFALLFVSCHSIVDTGDGMQNIVHEQNRLNNLADQKKINQLAKNISIENYSASVSELTATYANRISIVGKSGHSLDAITDKAFAIWPEDVRISPSQLQKEISLKLDKIHAKARKLKAKGKSTSAFNILLNSREADTTFTDLEKQYFKDVKKIFKKRHGQASYYSSELQLLGKKYQNQHSLTDKEYLVIIGISQSVSTYLDVLSKSDLQFSSAIRGKCRAKSGIAISGPMLKTGSVEEYDDCSDCSYTANDCSFDPDWGLIGG